MKKTAIYCLMAAALFMSSCSKDRGKTPGVTQGKCLADKLQYTPTAVNDIPSLHEVQVTFDVKNTGTEAYDVASGSNAVYAKLTVTTTNGKTYEEETILTASHISAGATASAIASVDYGAGNTYKSYKLETVSCK